MNLHDDSFLPTKTGYGDSVFFIPGIRHVPEQQPQSLRCLRIPGRRRSSFCGRRSGGNHQDRICHGQLFSSTGSSSAAGRLIMSDDDRAGASSVAVVSYALSQRRFGSAESATGKVRVDQPASVHRDRCRAASVLRRRPGHGAGCSHSHPLRPDARGRRLRTAKFHRPQHRMDSDHGSVSVRESAGRRRRRCSLRSSRSGCGR